MSYKWKPSNYQKKIFIEKMDEIDDFCKKNNIHQSLSSDSYYFTLHGINYRVSNHDPSPSNDCYDLFIKAGKTRIIETYNNIKSVESI